MIPTVSAALIVRNEQRTILRCLGSIIDAVDEIIVVDTGSTDETPILLERFAAANPKVKMFNFEWVEDFAAARNYSLDQATSDWIFVIDADEFLFDEDVERIRDVITSYTAGAGLYGLDVELINIDGDKIKDRHTSGVLRLFPNRQDVRYKGVIHENVDQDGRLNRRSVPIRLIHDGYDSNVVDQLQKKKRNLTLLNKALQEDPYNALNLMYFGVEVIEYDVQKGLNFFERAKKCANGNQAILDLIASFEPEFIARDK